MIQTKDYISGSDWWLNSENLPFSIIVRQSKMPDHWARYDSGHMQNIRSVLNPINRYAFSLYPRPQIIRIVNNIVTFRQRTHAEIWVEDKGKDVLYALDKCHQRQFYPSQNNLNSGECFKPTYKFYIPWFINKDIDIFIDPVLDEDTPFYIVSKTFKGKTISWDTPYADTEFVDFKIKNTGIYHLKEKYAIISKSTAMYDMSVALNDEEIGRLKDDYGQ